MDRKHTSKRARERETKEEEGERETKRERKLESVVHVAIDWSGINMYIINPLKTAVFIDKYASLFSKMISKSSFENSIKDYHEDILNLFTLFENCYVKSIRQNKFGLTLYDYIFNVLVTIMKLDYQSRRIEMSLDQERRLFKPKLEHLEDIIINFHSQKIDVKPYEFMIEFVSQYMHTHIKEVDLRIRKACCHILQSLLVKTRLKKPNVALDIKPPNSANATKENFMNWMGSYYSSRLETGMFNQIQTYFFKLRAPTGLIEKHIQNNRPDAAQEHFFKIMDDYFKNNIDRTENRFLYKQNLIRESVAKLIEAGRETSELKVIDLIKDKESIEFGYFCVYSFFWALSLRYSPDALGSTLPSKYIILPPYVPSSIPSLKEIYESRNPDIVFRPRIVFYQREISIFSPLRIDRTSEDYQVFRIDCENPIHSIIIWCYIMKKQFNGNLGIGINISSFIKSIFPRL